MNPSRIASLFMLGGAAMLGAMGRPVTPGLAAERPVLWLHAGAGREAAAERARPVAGALLSALVREEIQPVAVDDAPDLGWWSPGDAPADALRIGLDLNALRAAHPELFNDQRLNAALLELGLANARGIVLQLDLSDAAGARGGAAQVTVSFRDWDAGRSEALPLSPARAPALGTPGAERLAITPSWREWIDAGLAAHRAMLDPLRRSPFEAELESWNRRHEPKLRQVTASLEGPAILGAVGQDAYALIGVGPRADVGMLQRNLAIVLAPLGESSFDPRAAVGRVRVGALAGTELESLEWRVIELERRKWVLVTADGRGEALAESLTR